MATFTNKSPKESCVMSAAKKLNKYLNNFDDNAIQKLKDELKTCYEYKHKLERDREKSKDVIATLMTMM